MFLSPAWLLSAQLFWVLEFKDSSLSQLAWIHILELFFYLILNTPPQAQLYRDNNELGTEQCKPRERQGLGEDICQLIFTREEPNGNKFDSNHSPKKMKINFYLLRASMENKIGGKISGPNVITPQNRTGRNRCTKFRQKRA